MKHKLVPVDCVKLHMHTIIREQPLRKVSKAEHSKTL